MTCLAGGGGGYYSPDQKRTGENQADPIAKLAVEAHQIAQLAASRQAAMLAKFQLELEEDRTEATELGDEPMSPEANAICLRVAKDLVDSLVWHDFLTVSVSATNHGGASLVLTNKSRSKRLAIKVARTGETTRAIQIGPDNVVVEGPYDFERATEYVRWFL
jgi:hypothetical protein